MSIEEYKKANDGISVSESRKSEILSAVKVNTTRNPIRVKKVSKYLSLAACMAFALGIGIGIGTIMKPPTTIGENTTVSNTQEATKRVYFNDGSAYEPLKIPMFKVEGEETFAFEALPEFISANLAVPPNGYTAKDDFYIARYSTGWYEFYVDEKEYYSQTDKSILSVWAERRTAYVKPQMHDWIASKIGKNDKEVYLLEYPNENTYMAVYIVNDTQFFITVKSVAKDKFIEIIENIF